MKDGKWQKMVLGALMYLLPFGCFGTCLLIHQFASGADFQFCPIRNFHFLSHWEVFAFLTVI